MLNFRTKSMMSKIQFKKLITMKKENKINQKDFSKMKKIMSFFDLFIFILILFD